MDLNQLNLEEKPLDDYRKARHKKREANRAKLHAKKAAQEARKPKPKTGVGRGVPAYSSKVELEGRKVIYVTYAPIFPIRRKKSTFTASSIIF